MAELYEIEYKGTRIPNTIQPQVCPFCGQETDIHSDWVSKLRHKGDTYGQHFHASCALFTPIIDKAMTRSLLPEGSYNDNLREAVKQIKELING